MKSLRVFLIISVLMILPMAQASDLKDVPIFVIGQDVGSIKDYMTAFKQFSAQPTAAPKGFMVYTAINDLRGLSMAVDQGAGVNDADQLIHDYPQWRIVQIGLYMRYMLGEIVKGSFDQNIKEFGQWIKNSKKDVYLRIGYEFDNPDNDYDPKEYINAYRYIVDKLRQMNVTNVHFVWHTMAWKDDNWPAYDPLKWYPGDRYVDWVGISFFDTKDDAERNQAAALARKLNKPLMIAESSPFHQSSTEDKKQWIDKLFEYIKANHVTFLSYIDVNWDALPMFKDNKFGDARLQNDPTLMKEWLTQLQQL